MYSMAVFYAIGLIHPRVNPWCSVFDRIKRPFGFIPSFNSPVFATLVFSLGPQPGIRMIRQNLSQILPGGRILSLDILRGLAILVMTLYHQTIPFHLDTFGIGYQLSLFTGYYIVPLFIAVSGVAIVFYEKKYRWPFRMIVHGVALFMMAWCADIISHQSFRIDWDIFQLIGACYAISGFFHYIRSKELRYVVMMGLIFTWIIFSDIRPDQGLRPIWPYGIFFLGGYLLCQWATSQYSSAWTGLAMLMASIAYLLFFYAFQEQSIRLSTNAYGLSAAFAGTYILIYATLYLEIRQTLSGPLVWFLKQFGVYPISLYFIQQFFTVYGPQFGLKFALASIGGIDCIIQILVLLSIMSLSTVLFDRFKFFCVEFWLRKTESIVLDRVPAIGILSRLTAKQPL
jgi:hypothetical protein